MIFIFIEPQLSQINDRGLPRCPHWCEPRPSSAPTAVAPQLPPWESGNPRHPGGRNQKTTRNNRATNHWLGLREYLQEPWFLPWKKWGCPVIFFPTKPISWTNQLGFSTKLLQALPQKSSTQQSHWRGEALIDELPSILRSARAAQKMSLDSCIWVCLKMLG